MDNLNYEKLEELRLRYFFEVNYGLKVVTSKFIRDEIEVRWHKKKRINKKFMKKYKHKKIKYIPGRKYYILFDEYLYCHPKTLEKIRKKL